MSLFLSTTVNRIDKKGRISVPAGFRAAVSGQSFQGVVLMRSTGFRALEGFAMDAMNDLAARLDRFDVFSNDQDDLATAIFAEAVQLAFDGDGRITLPQDLMEYAGLAENAAFVGLGRKFQVWDPRALEARRLEARDNVKSRSLTLPAVSGAVNTDRGDKA